MPAHFEPVASGPHVVADGLDHRLDRIVGPTWQAFAVRIEDRQVIVGRGGLKHLGGGRQLDEFHFAAVPRDGLGQPFAPVGHRHVGPIPAGRSLLQVHQPDFGSRRQAPFRPAGRWSR